MTLVVMQVKWSVTLTDRLGPEILTVLERKGQVLHRVRLHVKVPGWSLNLNARVTKKFSKFLSRLNELSGGRENMCLVSGSLRRIFKFFRRFSFMALTLFTRASVNGKPESENATVFLAKRGVMVPGVSCVDCGNWG